MEHSRGSWASDGLVEWVEGGVAYLSVAFTWRFAYDDAADREHVVRVMRMLDRARVPARRRQVYTMIGNEPFAACMERIEEVIAWGGEPYAQPYMKLNALAKRPHVRFDWTESRLRRVQRWVNGRFWRYTDFAGYDASARTRPVVDQPGLDLNTLLD